MNTKHLNIKIQNDLISAISMLKQGLLVAFPTETVYGLGANIWCKRAILNIFKAKKRPIYNPLIIHITSIKQIFNIIDIKKKNNFKIILNRLLKLANKFWPGPLSIIGYKKSYISNIITANFNKVAIRIPNHNTAQKIISLTGHPVAAPSANKFSRPSATSSKHVLTTLNNKINAVIHDDTCSHGIESTIIDISEKYPIILRLGCITIKDIQNTLNEKIQYSISPQTNKPHLSPGLHNKHYSPNIENIMLCNKTRLEHYWYTHMPMLLKKKSYQFFVNKLGARPNNVITEILSNNPQMFAQKLYETLYKLEKKNISHLCLEQQYYNIINTIWSTINDKLKKASK